MKNPPQHRNWLSRMRLPLASAALVLAVVLVSAVITTQSAQAQTFTTLHSFDGTDGANPEYMSLVQGPDGNLYGTTSSGEGTERFGTVFKLTPTGVLTTIFTFDYTNGAYPAAGLVLGTDGNFYGTTAGGGSPATGGTVFKITPSGTLTSLHSFDGTDGDSPNAGLVQGTDGKFYGTTFAGGANANGYPGGDGTVFSITSSGKFTSLHSFNGSIDGYYIYAGLVEAADGNFYGSTGNGPLTNGGFDSPNGSVYKITPSGTLTTLYAFPFDEPNGGFPQTAPIQAADGNLYGTTNGTFFKMTCGGTLTTLFTFDGPDGDVLFAPLIQASNGKFYSTTEEGGANGYGTVFSITRGGTLTTLHSFDSTDGASPYGGLVQATNGKFYGTTYEGGASGDGTLFSLAVGLGSFVKTLPASGKVGAAVKILGTDLTGATGVSFNGTAATFTLVSSTEITTAVPAGATAGSVTVTTPSGTLRSNQQFRVTPQILSLSQPSGPVGTMVTITGVSLTHTAAVVFGGVRATNFTVNSDTSVTATVPTGALTGKIGITTTTTPCGYTAASPGVFTVTPAIISFNPPSGAVGTSVTITGTSFTGATSVTFNGVSATFNVVDDTQVTTTVPTGATTGPITLTTPVGTATSSTNFVVQ